MNCMAFAMTTSFFQMISSSTNWNSQMGRSLKLKGDTKKIINK